MVQTFGNQFLARAALTDDEHWPVQRRSSACALDRVEKRQALADELFRSLHALSPTVGGKSHHLARFFALFRTSKTLKFRNFAVSANVARLLNGRMQVKGPDFEFGVLE